MSTRVTGSDVEERSSGPKINHARVEYRVVVVESWNRGSRKYAGDVKSLARCHKEAYSDNC